MKNRQPERPPGDPPREHGAGGVFTTLTGVPAPPAWDNGKASLNRPLR
jgi:hypothetical protein